MKRALLLLAGCGRVGFADVADAASDAVTAVGHDEDGDGVPDSIDTCPHLVAPQTDTDGDGIGDACDPEPANPRQHVLLFATMQPSDQPFTEGTPADYVQLPDALRFTGNGGSSLFISTAPFTNVRVQTGITIQAVVGTTGVQHQIALQAYDASPMSVHDFVEFNETLPTYSNAQISRYNGLTYDQRAAMGLPSNLHPGDLTIESTALSGGSMTLDGGWPGEPYQVTDPAAAFAGGNVIDIDINSLVCDIRYIWAVSW